MLMCFHIRRQQLNLLTSSCRTLNELNVQFLVGTCIICYVSLQLCTISMLRVFMLQYVCDFVRYSSMNNCVDIDVCYSVRCRRLRSSWISTSSTGSLQHIVVSLHILLPTGPTSAISVDLINTVDFYQTQLKIQISLSPPHHNCFFPGPPR